MRAAGAVLRSRLRGTRQAGARVLGLMSPTTAAGGRCAQVCVHSGSSGQCPLRARPAPGAEPDCARRPGRAVQADVRLPASAIGCAEHLVQAPDTLRSRLPANDPSLRSCLWSGLSPLGRARPRPDHGSPLRVAGRQRWPTIRREAACEGHHSTRALVRGVAATGSLRFPDTSIRIVRIPVWPVLPEPSDAHLRVHGRSTSRFPLERFGFYDGISRVAEAQ